MRRLHQPLNSDRRPLIINSNHKSSPYCNKNKDVHLKLEKKKNQASLNRPAKLSSPTSHNSKNMSLNLLGHLNEPPLHLNPSQMKKPMSPNNQANEIYYRHMQTMNMNMTHKLSRLSFGTVNFDQNQNTSPLMNATGLRQSTKTKGNNP